MPRSRSPKPDVLLDQSMSLSGAFLRKIKRHVRLLVGNHSGPLPADWDFDTYRPDTFRG